MSFSKQQQKVIAHVERWGSINAIEAIKQHGITRLAARVHELRHTNRAMKAVKDIAVAKGFVTYVPDYEARFLNLRVRMGQELYKAQQDPLALAEVSYKYAAKLALMGAHMKGQN